MHFDIETDTTGIFPTPDRNAVIAIGCAIGDQKKLFVSETYDDDKKIIEDFFKFIKYTDPDIFSGYNTNKFDIPYLLERMKINNISPNLWSRTESEPQFYNNNVYIDGRISFDIYNEVVKDQTIYGIKNRRMKTLAKWLNLNDDIVEVDPSQMRNLVNTKDLREYLKSDVRITEALFNIYFKNVLTLAEMNKIPLNIMVDASASFLPRIIHGRAFKKLNIIADKNNGERYPKHIHKKQGALVDTFKHGLYLNEGLSFQKQGFGARGIVYQQFEYDL